MGSWSEKLWFGSKVDETKGKGRVEILVETYAIECIGSLISTDEVGDLAFLLCGGDCQQMT